MILHAVEHCYAQIRAKEWDKTYWAVDIHGTTLYPDYGDKNKVLTYYPYAKEVLHYLSHHPAIVLILYTCSWPGEIKHYMDFFKKDEIYFDYVNENPEIPDNAYGYYKNKIYFNVLIEDKAGFDPENDWEKLNAYFKKNPIPKIL